MCNDRKRINRLEEVYDGKELLTKDLINLDLSHIDLSVIPVDKWEGCTFKNVILDDYYLSLDYSDFDYRHNKSILPLFFDIYTIKNNPKLKLPSYYILMAISMYIGGETITNSNKENIVNECEEMLKYDSQGYLAKFYGVFKNNFDVESKYYFFAHCDISDQYLKDLDITGIPYDILSQYSFSRNIFDNVTFNNDFSELLRLNGSACPYFFYDVGECKNTYKSINLPAIKYNSWQENKNKQRRISNSSITFLTKVYLELSRLCNANCSFCRNQTFEKSEYHIENIIKALESIKNYIHIVVIGGGEPTLRISDVVRLIDMNDEIDWHMFSNGTNKELINHDFITSLCKINISRHAINENENAKIFGISPNSMMTLSDIARLNEKTEVTLNATCFQGGLDSCKKIMEYIDACKDLGFRKVLIQNLQKSVSLGIHDFNYDKLYISDEIFEQVIKVLNEEGFRSKYPICGTGGYVSYIYKDMNDFQVTIQKYIDEKELEEHWVSAIKRTFDLSIDPLGNLYENWNQRSNVVKVLKK